MKHKKYTINNLEDMLNCINPDNIDNFLQGFSDNLRRYITFVTAIRDECKKDGNEKINKLKNTEILNHKRFIFIDDGKNNNEIQIITK